MRDQEKKTLRKHYRALREDVPGQRRYLAAQEIERTLLECTANSEKVLSYASFGSELETTNLNRDLARVNKLILPRCDGNQLRLFKVTDPTSQLETSKAGIPEPMPGVCEEIDPEAVDTVIVPGLVFDTEGARIGSGQGYYDRLLSRMPQAATIGVAFHEQRSPQALPSEHHDRTVDEVMFF